MSPRRQIVPATAEDIELVQRVRVGDLLPVEIRRARNGQHHRKMMALITFVAENHPGLPDEETGEIKPWAGPEAVKTWLKIRTQHFHGMQVYKGAVYLNLRSISYRELDEDEFALWAKAAKEIIFTELFPGLRDRERIEFEIDAWTAWN